MPFIQNKKFHPRFVFLQDEVVELLKTEGRENPSPEFCSELTDITFLAESPDLLVEPNMRYAYEEHEWYLSGDANIRSFPGKVPQIWQDVSDSDGYVNSNYGAIVLNRQSEHYGVDYGQNDMSQLLAVIKALSEGRTRHAIINYQSRDMHARAVYKGAYDFTCTLQTIHFLETGDDGIRKHCMKVYFRSNDVRFGYPYDYLWHKYVQDTITDVLDTVETPTKSGELYWHAQSLHVYHRNEEILK